MDETEDLLRRRLVRERSARKAAETIIEEKSRELYAKSRDLEAAVAAATRARRESETLRDALQAFTSGLRAEDILRRLGGFLERLVAFSGCAIYVIEDGGLLLKATCGAAPECGADPAPAAPRLRDALGRSASPVVAASAAEAAELAAAWGVPLTGASLMLVPMLTHASTTGCLVVCGEHADAFDALAARLTQALANEAALALENARLFAEVERLSHVDALTGLHNRRHFAQASASEWERTRRHGLRLAALLLDIDHFKGFNDTYGHAAGDRVLAGVAAVCRGTIRRIDLDARYGGEEFCFLLPETGLDDALKLAERLRAAVAALRVEAEGRQLQVTVSIGAAERRPDDRSVDDLLSGADAALYEAKRGGRDRVVARARLD